MTVPKKKTQKQILKEQGQAMPLLPANPAAAVMKDARAVINKKAPIPEGEAKALTDLSQSEGWILLRKHLEKANDKLFELTRKAARQSGDNMQTAGFAFAIYDFFLEHTEEIIKFVENPLKEKAFERDPDNPDDADEAENA